MCVPCPINKDWLSSHGISPKEGRETKCIQDLYDAPYPSHLHKLKIPSLTYWYKHGDVITAYKLLNAQYTIPDLLQLENWKTTHGHFHKLFQRQANTRLRNKLFSNRVMSLWNSPTEKKQPLRVWMCSSHQWRGSSSLNHGTLLGKP